MILYIIGYVLLFIGIFLSAHRQRNELRDTWALILIGAGLLLILVRIAILVWRSL